MIVPGNPNALWLADCVAELNPAAVWTARSTPLGSPAATNSLFYAMAFSPSLGRMVAVGPGTNKSFIYSDDGITWTRVALANETFDWRAIAWSPSQGRFAALSFNGNENAYSSDGINWTVASGQITGIFNITALIWAGGSINKFVAIGILNTGHPCVATSSDGINWTQSDIFGQVTQGNYACLAYSESLGLLVAGGDDNGGAGSYNLITSPDAINWTPRAYLGNPATHPKFQYIAWNPQLAIFVIFQGIGLAAFSRYRGYSSDGINWTIVTDPANYLHITALVSVPDYGFYACDDDVLGGTRLKSYDGINWSTDGTFPSVFYSLGVAPTIWNEFATLAAGRVTSTTQIYTLSPFLPC